MDIGREVRRYRAEPLSSPVPGEAPAPVEEVPTTPAATVSTPTVPSTTDASRPQEAVEARA